VIDKFSFDEKTREDLLQLIYFKDRDQKIEGWEQLVEDFVDHVEVRLDSYRRFQAISASVLRGRLDQAKMQLFDLWKTLVLGDASKMLGQELHEIFEDAGREGNPLDASMDRYGFVKSMERHFIVLANAIDQKLAKIPSREPKIPLDVRDFVVELVFEYNLLFGEMPPIANRQKSASQIQPFVMMG
jgi:hypothetical protein